MIIAPFVSDFLNKRRYLAAPYCVCVSRLMLMLMLMPSCKPALRVRLFCLVRDKNCLSVNEQART